MSHQQEIISYYGHFSYEITGEIIEEFGKKREEYNISKALFRKILTLMVEILENNYKYMESMNKDELKGITHKPKFVLRQENSDFIIESGNPILEKDIKPLKNKIDHINGLQYDELKDLYKNTMSEGIYDNQRGAGLGIMKMARVSKNKIFYSIENIKNNVYYYTIAITISSK
jgi:hypothetical protein